VSINGTTYIDGGARSGANADLARGADVVVVLAPMTVALSPEHEISHQLERTGAGRTLAISPDPTAVEDMGTNALDPARRQESARTGLRQGALLADDVAAVWR
jgi:NTE family protein